MDADTPPKPPAWVYGMLHHPDETSYIKTPDDALEHALAVQRIARLMILGMNAPDELSDGDEELLEHVSLYGWLWTRRASELLAAERAATRALPDGVVTKLKASATELQPEKVTNLMEGLTRSIARKRVRQDGNLLRGDE